MPAHTKAKDEDKTEEQSNETTSSSTGNMTIVGEGKKNAIGLFQTSPDTKEWMTAEEAEAAGFYVAPEEKEKKKKG